MSPKINQLLTDLNEQLNFTDLEIDDPIKRCESAIDIILKSLQKLKVLFEKHTEEYPEAVDVSPSSPYDQNVV